MLALDGPLLKPCQSPLRRSSSSAREDAGLLAALTLKSGFRSLMYGFSRQHKSRLLASENDDRRVSLLSPHLSRDCARSFSSSRLSYLEAWLAV